MKLPEIVHSNVLLLKYTYVHAAIKIQTVLYVYITFYIRYFNYVNSLDLADDDVYSGMNKCLNL